MVEYSDTESTVISGVYDIDDPTVVSVSREPRI